MGSKFRIDGTGPTLEQLKSPRGRGSQLTQLTGHLRIEYTGHSTQVTGHTSHCAPRQAREAQVCGSLPARGSGQRNGRRRDVASRNVPADGAR